MNGTIGERVEALLLEPTYGLAGVNCRRKKGAL